MNSKWRLSGIFLALTATALLFFFASIVSRPKEEWNESFFPYPPITSKQVPPTDRAYHHIGWSICVRNFIDEGFGKPAISNGENDSDFLEVDFESMNLPGNAFVEIGYKQCRNQLIAKSEQFSESEMRELLLPRSNEVEVISFLFAAILFVTYLTARLGANFEKSQ